MTKPKKPAPPPETEPCWYCRRADAVLWCDFMLGGVHGPPEQIPLPVDAAPWSPGRIMVGMVVVLEYDRRGMSGEQALMQAMVVLASAGWTPGMPAADLRAALAARGGTP